MVHHVDKTPSTISKIQNPKEKTTLIQDTRQQLT